MHPTKVFAIVAALVIFALVIWFLLFSPGYIERTREAEVVGANSPQPPL